MTDIWDTLLQNGFLRVDDEGRVWRDSIRTRTGQIKHTPPQRADHPRPDGYRDVRVQINGQTHFIKAHQLVYRALVGPLPPPLEINHKNGRRDDNRPENLEATTKSGNLKHAYDQLGRARAAGERNGMHKLTIPQVAAIRQRHAAGEGIRPLARAYGVTPPLIRKITRGELWRGQFPEVHL